MEKQAYQSIINQIKEHNAQLVAVSKTKPNEDIMALYNYGQRAFGENRAQELTEKQSQLPADIKWHMIGHLQTNKVKYIAPFVHLIHSIDSFKVLKEVNKEARKNDRTIDCLLQIKIAKEDTKYGFDEHTLKEMLESEAYAKLEHVHICGVMGMATFTDDEQQVRREFRQLHRHFEQLQERYFSNTPYFKEISMGMSGDYEWALDEGSTMVRIGNLLFGPRKYD